jgi:hypothetical protein
MNHHALATELADKLAQYVPADDPFLRYVRCALAMPTAGCFKRGEANPSSVLTADDVRRMRALRDEGNTYGQIAIRYGISAKQVWRICNYHQWSWVQ